MLKNQESEIMDKAKKFIDDQITKLLSKFNQETVYLQEQYFKIRQKSIKKEL